MSVNGKRRSKTPSVWSSTYIAGSSDMYLSKTAVPSNPVSSVLLTSILTTCSEVSQGRG